jgi:hypothetical protein
MDKSIITGANTTSACAPTAVPVRTWRQRLGLAADFPLFMPTDVERAMVAEIAELRNVATAAPSPARYSAATPAALAVLGERQRQQQEEGWSAAHDDAYRGEELRWAAVCYALYMTQQNPPAFWPWPPEWWKPRDRRANLVRAAALLIAEIERIDRDALACKPDQQKGGEV